MIQEGNGLSQGFPSCGAHTINDTQILAKQPKTSSYMHTSTAATVAMVIYEQGKLEALLLVSGRKAEVCNSLEGTGIQTSSHSVKFSDMPHVSLLRNFVILSFPKLCVILFHYLI